MLALLPATRPSAHRPASGRVDRLVDRLADLLGDLVDAGPEEAERLVGTMAGLDPGLVGATVRVEVVPGREVRLVRPSRPDLVHRVGRPDASAGPVGQAAGVSPEVPFEASSLRRALARAAHAAAWADIEPGRVETEEPGATEGTDGTRRRPRLAWDDLGVRQLVLDVDPDVLEEWAAPVARLIGPSGEVLATTLLTYLDLAATPSARRRR